MKHLVLLALLVLVPSAKLEDGTEAFFLEGKWSFGYYKCIGEIRVHPDFVKLYELAKETKRKDVKCFLKCLMQEIEFMDADGQIIDTGIKYFPEGEDRKKTKEIIERCKGQIGDDPCETGYALHRCWALGYVG